MTDHTDIAPAGSVVVDGRIDPVALATHYQRFRVAERLLFTGHSHQAWPDVSEAAHAEAWADAAEFVDDKWDHAETRAETVRDGYHRLLGDDDGGRLSLASSTHDLLVRLLSALDWASRPRIVTTDGEFHSARRQFDRLDEVGVEIVRVPAAPVDTLAERLAAEVDDRTAIVLVSKVLFASARIVHGLDQVAAAARRHGTVCCVDAYHAVNVLDWGVADDDLADAFVLGGGYKYLQCGEGNCFLRWPADTDLRPVVTGWYAEFGDLASPPAGGVAYGAGPERFAGATYDPTSHYRAAAVLGFFADHGLTPPRLRATSQHQIARLRDGIAALDLDPAVIRLPDVPGNDLAGFLAVTCADAEAVRSGLRARGVRVDHRGDVVRFGPAPYTSDAQIDAAIAAVGNVMRKQ